MSKHTHTPGPWDLQQLAAGQAIQAGPQNRICVLFDHQEHDGEPCGAIESQNKDQEEINANARLIAAAPSMFAALGKVLAMSQVHDPLTGRYSKVDPYDLHRIAFTAYCEAQGIDTKGR